MKRAAGGSKKVRGKATKKTVSAAKPAAGTRKSTAKKAGAAPTVAAYMRGLDHPLKADIEFVRTIVCGVSPTIEELVKWNAPSFRTHEDFASVNVRNRNAVQLVLHTGAKVKTNAKQPEIEDPKGVVKWLAKDRCLVTLGAGKEIAANRSALESIVRAWIRQL